jgi:hypothetical protein
METGVVYPSCGACEPGGALPSTAIVCCGTRRKGQVMLGHATLMLCDSCGRAIPDQSGKEVLYQIDRVRYRLELCSTCLAAEMKRHGGHRGVPGFRKRAAIMFTVSSTDELPRAVMVP